MNKPMGLRVFIKKIDNPLSNYGKDIFEGIISDVPTIQSVEGSFIINTLSTTYSGLDYKDYGLLFDNVEGLIKVGTKVTFKYNQEIVDNYNDIYNVPIELIRTYEQDEQ